MGKPAILKSEISKIRQLRKIGYSINEIKREVPRGYGTIFRYVKDTRISSEYREILHAKRGGKKIKSEKEWEESKDSAQKIIDDLNFKERMIALSCLYWGEGNKTELNVINSDPTLIRVMIACFVDMGIKKEDLKVSLRLFDDIDKNEAVNYWQKLLDLPKGSIKKLDILHGKKVGKLKYGMCRVRVKKSGKHFKLIMSMIDLIRSKLK